MAFDEEYLEDLLKSIEPIVNPDGTVEEGTDPDEIPDMPEEELDSNEAEPEEMVIVEEEEIPAPVAEEAVPETPVEEVTAVEEGVSEVADAIDVDALMTISEDEPNKTLTAEEIAAMFNAANQAEEAASSGSTDDVSSADEAGDDVAEVAVSEEVEPQAADGDSLDLGEMSVDMDDIDAFLNASQDAEEVSQDVEEVSMDDEMLLEAMLAESGNDIQDESAPVNELDMSADEIDAMLNAAKDSANDPVSLDGGDDDLVSLLSSVGDEDLSDIQNILDSDESGDAVAAAALDATTNVEDVASTVLETEKEAKARKKREKKEAKKAKKNKKAEAGTESADSDEPKKNFFVRIIEALTESVDDEDEFGIGDAVIVQTDETITPEEGMSGISDENKEILAELDEEKGKKKKKKKGKKGKKGEEAPEGEEGEEGEAAEPKKKKKPKKEKKPKVEKVDEYQKPEKRLPRKKVRATFALCFTLLIAILLAVFGLDKINTLRDARWAFDNQDYQTAYEDLYGVEVKGEDAEIFNKSQVILQVERKYKSYQNYMQLGMNYEAVDSLLEAVKLYPDIREKAANYGVAAQTDYTYSLIIAALQGMGVSEADAMEINAYDSKVRYTKRVKSIADGTPYTYDDEIAAEYVEDTVSDIPKTVDDILPEENDFLPDNPDSIFEVEMDLDEMVADDNPTPATDEQETQLTESSIERVNSEDGREIMQFEVTR